MLQSFNTVQHMKPAEIVIKRSRFIGHAKSVDTEEEAIAFIEDVRKQHSDATHNCYAYIIGERDQYQKQSDAGEPSGTAGKPILEVIKNRHMKNIVVVVTRYYGGIMLGAGGLVRAYTDGAVAGIDAAVPIWRKLHQEVRIEADYTWHGKIEHELRQSGTLMKETRFTEQVVVICLPLHSEAEQFVARLTDITQGQCTIQQGGVEYRTHQIE